MTHLLDTDTCIHLLRGTPSVVVGAERHSPADLAVSAITQFELLYGVERCPPTWRKREGAKVRLLLENLSVLPFTSEMAACAAKVRMALESAGRGIGPMDLLIAATAMEAGLLLVTNNLREFERVPGLKCLAWCQAG
ncbi:MAG: type II toxin-antitoxin system VapC family toxin [Terrimicrobiaceae bacterium]|nr:type II toxin-antitoxin system VapC family toxin [Terrimicrobiaceae bacterium]